MFRYPKARVSREIDARYVIIKCIDYRYYDAENRIGRTASVNNYYLFIG